MGGLALARAGKANRASPPLMPLFAVGVSKVEPHRLNTGDHRRIPPTTRGELRRRQSSSISPWRSASMTAPVRESTPSLLLTRSRCVLTVASLMSSSRAICAFDIPRATAASTSRSRADSAGAVSDGAAALLLVAASMRVVTAGLMAL